jgi:hypothetical protein
MNIILYTLVLFIGGITGYYIASIKCRNLNKYGLSKEMYLKMSIIDLDKKIDNLIQIDLADSYYEASKLYDKKIKLLKKLKRLKTKNSFRNEKISEVNS